MIRSPLATFNRWVPKDRGSKLLLRDVPFGDDTRQTLDLYGPTRSPGAAALPLIIFFYGGSWNSGFKEGYEFIGRALAARGFLVVIPDYRLVPEVRFPAFLEDCADATCWLLENAGDFSGDSNRLILMGHSAGAYNAAMLAVDNRWLGSRSASVRGLIGIAGPYAFEPPRYAATAQAFGHYRPQGETQPFNFVSPASPPALLLHGAADRTVSPRNSKDFARRLGAAGVQAEAKIYPRVDHVRSITDFAIPFRLRAPLLRDSASFAAQATAVCQPLGTV